MNFTSDNWAGASPRVQQALLEACQRTLPAYGADPITAALNGQVAELFQHEAVVFPVTTGTAANALALATLCPPTGAVFAHEEAHIVEDECGAPEFFSGGARLVPVPGRHGKLDARHLEAAVARFPDQTRFQTPMVLSLTQATEAGTLYTPAEIIALSAWAHGRGMTVHMDGARFANAVAALDVPPAELTWRAGVDVLSLGGTKAGALMAEAVVFFDSGHVRDFDRRRKRAGQAVSKARLISAQMLALLEDGHWLDLARHANRMARRLGDGLASAGRRLAAPVEVNEVFPVLPQAVAERLSRAGAAYYPWPARAGEALAPGETLVRLVTSWSTTAEEVDRFLALSG